MARGSKITSREEDYSAWYNDIVQHAEMADYSPVRGCMVIRPYGFAVWENIKDALDQMLKDTGHQNAYFPMFIPESFMNREAEHVEGFAPECAVVTHGGGKELEEPLYIRPTSETIIYHMYSKWVESWRDLPILLNQWANVCRWEMRTRMFLRTCEFLWQEGHTAHATEEEAEEEARRMLGVYRNLAENVMAMPVIPGRKTDAEKFAGANHTYTIEAMMQDFKALQAGTSHNLGQNFAKAFDLTFQDDQGELVHAWNTSWGVSTRLVGALIMSHSDDKGLLLPPRLAPIQIVIVPIWRTDEEKEAVLTASKELQKQLEETLESARKEGTLTAVPRRINVHLDDREHYKPGRKFYEWERKGVPVRVEIGPRDLKKNQVVWVRRDTSEKRFDPVDEFIAQAASVLETTQSALFEQAQERLQANTRTVSDYDEFKQVIEEQGGFIRVRFCGDPELEEQIKNETSATIRCLPFETELEPGPCFISGGEGTHEVIFAKAY